MHTIKLDNVSKNIRGAEIIKNISLTFVSPGIYGLKGINGSGKTMLMRLIAGLIRPSQGKVLFDDQELGKDLDFPPSMGLLLENPTFLNYLSGFDNLLYLAKLKNKIGPKEIRQFIELVGLNPDDKKHYGKYSLGMKQRLGIAAAIMESPDLVMLDEPTNSLDSDGVELVVDIVHKLKEEGKLVIVSCHDYALLRTMTDQIHVLVEGELVESEVTPEQ